MDIEWKRIGKAALVAVPLAAAAAGFWFQYNYFGLKKLPGYSHEAGLLLNQTIKGNSTEEGQKRRMQLRVADVDGFEG